MTLEQLRAFRVVARLGSFTQAAAELHLTQPAVSSQIIALETALKTRLFDRAGRSIALTAAGKIALDTAAEILHHVERLHQALDDLKELRTGALRVGASLAVGSYLLPEVLGRFKERYPHVDVALRIERANHITSLILRNAVDIGLVGEGAPAKYDRLVVEPLLRDELVVIVPPQHRWAGLDAIAPAALVEEPFIMPTRDFATSEAILQCVAAAGLRLRAPQEWGNTEAVKKAVETGRGISIVSRCTIQRELDTGSLKALSVRGVRLARNFLCCWRKGRDLSRAAKAFVDVLKE